jgi:hypothetical protein
LLSGCGAAGPETTIPFQSLHPAEGLDFTAARASTLAFLHAYATESSDHGDALRSLVEGSLIQEWAHWLIVQNDELPGTIRGTLRLGSVGTAKPTHLPGSQQAAISVDVQAMVTFQITPATGKPSTVVRNLDGPVLLVPVAPGDWRVWSFTRDGAALTQFVFPLGFAGRKGDVAVRLDVLIVAPGQLQFGAVVSNRSPLAVTLNGDETSLLDDSGKSLGSGKTVVSFPGPIPPDSVRESLLALPPLGQDSPDPVAMRVTLDPRAGKPIVLDVPLGAPSAGASPSPSG